MSKSLLLSVFLCFATNLWAGSEKVLVDHIRNKAIPLEKTFDLDKLIDIAKNKKLVLLGEASHGTHEYYAWRDSISRRLVREADFSFIAVEGDFASLYELNRYVKNLPGAASSASEVLAGLSRWPVWMWGNEEVAALAEWLRKHNDAVTNHKQKVGFYGIDVYDEWNSKDKLLQFIQKLDTNLYQQVFKHYQCFAPYNGDSWGYARALAQGKSDCSQSTRRVVELIKEAKHHFTGIDDYEYFFVLQNAKVKKNAEKFYRKSVTRSDASSWNARAHHMHNTVSDLLTLYGKNSKGIVWAHNTHVGDARFTEMAQTSTQNIGELSRVHHGHENVFSIGFTTYTGNVMAGSSWGSRMQNMKISSAKQNSFEDIFNKVGLKAFYMIFDDRDKKNDRFIEPRGHRAVGVVFNPSNEQRQYVNTILPLRYDAFVFFNTTRALHPLTN